MCITETMQKQVNIQSKKKGQNNCVKVIFNQNSEIKSK